MDEIVELYIRRNGPEFTLKQVAEGFKRTLTVYPEYTNSVAIQEIKLIWDELRTLIDRVERYEYEAQHGTKKDEPDATKC